MNLDYDIAVAESESLPNASYRVTVAGHGTITNYTVTLDTTYYKERTNGKLAPVELVRRSFLFLLEHEPPTSILRTFSLRDIARYFPSYEDTEL